LILPDGDGCCSDHENSATGLGVGDQMTAAEVQLAKPKVATSMLPPYLSLIGAEKPWRFDLKCTPN